MSTKHVLVSIFDRKAKIYTSFIVAKNIESALRSLRTAVNDSKMGDIYLYSSDYSLYHLANVDETTGFVEPMITPQQLVDLDELKNDSIANLAREASFS